MGSRFGLNDFEQIAIVGVLVAAFISLLYAWFLRRGVLKKDKGTAKMQEVWNAIRIGADRLSEPPVADDLAAHRRADVRHVLQRVHRASHGSRH